MSQTVETANSIVTVNLAKVKRNIERIRRHIGPDVEIMYTAKSNGYGHGLITPALYMSRECGIKSFATGMLSEALELREAGLEDFILILGGVPYNGLGECVKHDFAVTVYEDTVPKVLSREAVAQGKTAKVHIKIDTGLRRLGTYVGEPLERLLDLLTSLPGIEIDGIYTHFYNAYSLDKSDTKKQTAEFEQALAQLRARGIRPRRIHAANTAACVSSPETYYDMVRLAALIFGYDISPGEKNRLGLEPAMEWTGLVMNTLWAEAGDNVSYYGFYTPKRRTKIAILSFGMGDGYVRNLVTKDTAHNADVLIHGKRARLLDLNVDQAFADITDIPDVKIGDKVVLIGRDGEDEITSMDLGSQGGTSNGHICCSITSRPFRHYVYE